MSGDAHRGWLLQVPLCLQAGGKIGPVHSAAPQVKNRRLGVGKPPIHVEEFAAKLCA